jgi:predicted nucleotidyltransferase component of viral defense system
MNVISNCGANFYLTGGTALSRIYYHHRYSDDLDFFLNAAPDYQAQRSAVLAALKDAGFWWDETTPDEFIVAESFLMIKVHWTQSDATLKLDFVNDLAAHFGGLVESPLYPRIDSPRNIISNKLGAIFRYEAKDIADIWALARHENFIWREIFQEAQQKEGAAQAPLVTEVIRTLPQNLFDQLNWINKPDWNEFTADLDRIIRQMLGAE